MRGVDAPGAVFFLTRRKHTAERGPLLLRRVGMHRHPSLNRGGAHHRIGHRLNRRHSVVRRLRSMCFERGIGTKVRGGTISRTAGKPEHKPEQRRETRAGGDGHSHRARLTREGGVRLLPLHFLRCNGNNLTPVRIRTAGVPVRRGVPSLISSTEIARPGPGFARAGIP